MLQDPTRFGHVVFPEAAHLRCPVKFASPLPTPARQERARMSISPQAGEFIRWLFERSGLDAGCYRQASLARRLGACLRALRVNDVSEARVAIQADPALIQIALGALLIGVSGIFRDPSVFEDLWRQVLPHMAQRPTLCKSSSRAPGV